MVLGCQSPVSCIVLPQAKEEQDKQKEEEYWSDTIYIYIINKTSETGKAKDKCFRKCIGNNH